MGEKGRVCKCINTNRDTETPNPLGLGRDVPCLLNNWGGWWARCPPVKHERGRVLKITHFCFSLCSLRFGITLASACLQNTCHTPPNKVLHTQTSCTKDGEECGCTSPGKTGGTNTCFGSTRTCVSERLVLCESLIASPDGAPGAQACTRPPPKPRSNSPCLIVPHPRWLCGFV